MSLYRATFHATPIDLCILFKRKLYISRIMSYGNKHVLVVVVVVVVVVAGQTIWPISSN